MFSFEDRCVSCHLWVGYISMLISLLDWRALSPDLYLSIRVDTGTFTGRPTSQNLTEWLNIRVVFGIPSCSYLWHKKPQYWPLKITTLYVLPIFYQKIKIIWSSRVYLKRMHPYIVIYCQLVTRRLQMVKCFQIIWGYILDRIILKRTSICWQLFKIWIYLQYKSFRYI